MLTIEVELLTGRYAATAHNDRYLAEWPPHPARFFSALVAALHEEEPIDLQEREALLWLERQPAPSLDVDVDCNFRRVLDVFVPVNDITIVGDPEKPVRAARALVESLPEGTSAKEAKRAKAVLAKEETKLAAFISAQQVVDPEPAQTALNAAMQLLPERRTRQVRTFPVALPEHSRFSFSWPDEPASAIGEALQRLCARVTRLGHSSSLVRCLIVDRTPNITLVPTTDGTRVLRTIGPGQLEQLEEAYARHQAVEQRSLPFRPQSYGPVGDTGTKPAAQGVFADEWIMFERKSGARLLSSRTADVCKALRASLIEQAGSEPLPAVLSGHLPNGDRFTAPHIAFVAPPFVGHEHADASIQGCAIIVPRDLSPSDRLTLLRLIAKWESNRSQNGLLTLAASNLPAMQIQRVEVAKRSLQDSRWCRPSRRFVTATPIALDRHPGNLRSNQGQTSERASIEAQQIIANACVNIGLPRPASVEISSAPLLQGAQPVRAFAPWPAVQGRTPRVRVHAEIQFDERVRGPVLLGAGRYFGLGLCLPVSENV
jgi:CRISPR-associated protein Csb2